MTPGFEERLFKELGQLHGNLQGLDRTMGAHERRDDERHSDLVRRLVGLEERSETTGRHELAKTEKALEKMQADEDLRKKIRAEKIVDMIVKVCLALGGFFLALAARKLGL